MHRNSLNDFDGKPLQVRSRCPRGLLLADCADYAGLAAWALSWYDGIHSEQRPRWCGSGSHFTRRHSPHRTDPPANGRPKDCLLVDLAVVERESLRVRDHLTIVALPLNDVSFVILTLDSELEESENLLRRYLIHRKYLQQCSQRKNEGNASKLLFAWYNNRFIEIRNEIRKILPAWRQTGYSLKTLVDEILF